jgi:hypothetical protein
MDAPQEESYPTEQQSTWVLFDLRIPSTAARLHRERAAWAENGDIEALDQDHYILIVRTGGALVGTEERSVHGG